MVTRAKLVSFIDNRDRQNPISLVLPANSGKNFYTAEFHPETPALILVNSETGGPNVFDRRMQARFFLLSKGEIVRFSLKKYGICSTRQIFKDYCNVKLT